MNPPPTRPDAGEVVVVRPGGGAIEVASLDTSKQQPSEWVYLEEGPAVGDQEAERERIGPVYTTPGRTPQLRVLDRPALKGDTRLLPLEHTSVDAQLVGPVARVEVSQRYRNPYDVPIEAVYVFPLPENSAVDRMRLRVGDRVIEGVVRERAQARAIYEEAKANGHVAALLEQERPNVFTQSVANIAPRAKVEVDVGYVQDLTYDAGRYEFVFPMVVGARFNPGGGDGGVVQASVIGAGMRSGHDVSFRLRADAGVPIRSYEVPTHDVTGGVDEAGRLSIALAREDEIPNRDMVVRYSVAGEQPAASVLSEWRGDDEGFFTLVVQPPEADVNALIGTRELIFMVDVSGSMRGVPMAMCKEAMIEALRGLRPVDTFNIITFAGGTQQLFASAQPANQEAIQYAMTFVEEMKAGGGTRMLEAIRHVLGEALEPGVQRALVFMTDGYIGNEADVLNAINVGVERAKKNNARIRAFAMGVGASTNRYLIEGVSKEGEGTAHYALTREDPAEAVRSFMGVIDHPIWTDVEVDFGELDVVDVYPRGGDLFASRPLVIHGRYRRAGAGTVVLRATAQGQRVELPFAVTLSRNQASTQGPLGTLWARARIEARERDLLYGARFEDTREEIIALAERFGLASRFTSFVAVDHAEVIEGGASLQIRQWRERVEDVD